MVCWAELVSITPDVRTNNDNVYSDVCMYADKVKYVFN